MPTKNTLVGAVKPAPSVGLNATEIESLFRRGIMRMAPVPLGVHFAALVEFGVRIPLPKSEVKRRNSENRKRWRQAQKKTQ